MYCNLHYISLTSTHQACSLGLVFSFFFVNSVINVFKTFLFSWKLLLINIIINENLSNLYWYFLFEVENQFQIDFFLLVLNFHLLFIICAFGQAERFRIDGIFHGDYWFLWAILDSMCLITGCFANGANVGS